MDLAKKQFLKYTFYRFKPGWRQLPAAERRAGVRELVDLAAAHAGRVELRSYSTTGLKADAEFLLWGIADDVEFLHDFGMDLVNTAAWPHLRITHSYLAMHKPSQYVPEDQHAKTQSATGPQKYLFIYPFVKSKAWYQVPFTDRRAMMGQHQATGLRYPTIRINTGYSFGLDDQEFVVSFEGPDPAEFLEMVQEMRTSKATAFTERDTPMFTCLSMALPDLLNRLSFRKGEPASGG